MSRLIIRIALVLGCVAVALGGAAAMAGVSSAKHLRRSPQVIVRPLGLAAVQGFSSKRRTLGLKQAQCSSWPGTDCYYAFINKTPYVMKLLSADAYFIDHIHQERITDKFDFPPAQTLQPGQKTVFGFTEPGVGSSWDAAEIRWTFTDVNGGKHRADYNIDTDGNPFLFSLDAAPDGSFNDGASVSTATFHMESANDGYPNDFAAVLSHPAEATIDANTNPAAATSVMKLFEQGTNRSYTPTTGLSFTNTNFKQASARVQNATNEPVSLRLTGSDTQQETTSIGLELRWSASLDILGLVDQSLSASITGGHSWGTSDTTSNSVEVPIDAGDEGWVQTSTTNATITGNFNFTTPEGITYHVLNATVTEPGFGPNGPIGALTFSPFEQPITTDRPQSVLQKNTFGVRKETRMTSLTRARKRAKSRCLNLQSHRRRAPTCRQWVTSAADGTVVIDAKANPKDAAAAMALFPVATNKTYTATSNPIYARTGQAVLSNSWETPATFNAPTHGTLSVAHDYSSSWSLGGSVGAETTLSALGFANASVSVTFTANHEWVTSHSDSQDVTVTVDPGYIAHIEGYTGTVTFTGDYTFTANGVNYQVNNVTITEPGNSKDGPLAASTYIVIAQKLNTAARRSTKRPGYRSPSQTANLIK
jgi:hypothetical protein